jgi:hypothetical protein
MATTSTTSAVDGQGGTETQGVLDHIRQHIYRPLIPWQTRLIRLHPDGDIKSPVTCDLLVVDVIAAGGLGIVDESIVVESEAISYTWERPDLTSVVKCNGKPLPVADTLLEALQHFRRPETARYLRVDLCCIDQANM